MKRITNLCYFPDVAESLKEMGPKTKELLKTVCELMYNELPEESSKDDSELTQRQLFCRYLRHSHRKLLSQLKDCTKLFYIS